MHEVPLPQQPFLALDEQERLAGEDEDVRGRDRSQARFTSTGAADDPPSSLVVAPCP